MLFITCGSPIRETVRDGRKYDYVNMCPVIKSGIVTIFNMKQSLQYAQPLFLKSDTSHANMTQKRNINSTAHL